MVYFNPVTIKKTNTVCPVQWELRDKHDLLLYINDRFGRVLVKLIRSFDEKDWYSPIFEHSFKYSENDLASGLTLVEVIEIIKDKVSIDL